MDKDGNMVALTMTLRNGFRSGVTGPGTGTTLTNGMGLLVSAPRFHVEQKEPSVVEAALPYGIGSELEARGHNLEVRQAWGAVHAIVLGPETGKQLAARESRQETSAAGALVRKDR